MSRVWESVKTVLIVLLLCLAILLAASLISELVSGQSLSTRLGKALGWIPSEPSYSQRSESYTAAAMPLTISMTGELGRGSTQGDPDRTAALYTALSRQLGEALANAETPGVLEQDAWQRLLSGESATLLYAGAIPLESLAHWLGATPSRALAGLSVEHLTLCVDGEQISLLLHTDRWLRLRTGCDPEGLRHALEQRRPDGSIFALEDGRYERIDPMSLITVSTVMPTVESHNSLADGDSIDAAATLLGLNPYRDTAYTSASGTVTITGGAGRLQVTSAGVLDYTASSEASRTAAGQDDTAIIEVARLLITELSDGLTGDAALQLSGLVRDGSTVTVRFDYVLGGYPIWQSQGAAAELVYQDGTLHSLRWIARRYLRGEESQSLLSARQAASIITEHSRLQAAYIDTGSKLVCGWLE